MNLPEIRVIGDPCIILPSPDMCITPSPHMGSHHTLRFTHGLETSPSHNGAQYLSISHQMGGMTMMRPVIVAMASAVRNLRSWKRTSFIWLAS